MPAVTRSQSLQHNRGEEASTATTGKKPVRRSGSSRGHIQSRLTRTFWETRLREFRTDPVFLSGEIFARTVDPFTNIRKLLEDEVKVERDLIAMSQTWRHMIYPSHRLDQQMYLAIKSLLSPEEDVTRCTIAVHNHIVTLLSKGQTNAWSCDLRTAQELVHRGFEVQCGEEVQEHCTQVGHLLRPIDHPSGDNCPLDEIGKPTVAPQSQPQPLSPGSWPAILYQNMEFNSHQPEEGFLMNRLLVTVYKAIHRRPTGVTNPGRKLSKLTLASIVYIATLVVSAVAAPETYPHRRLFRLLSEFLEQHRQEAWYRELLRWWGRQIEGPPLTTHFNLTRRVVPKSGPSILDRLRGVGSD
ncbi:hypothetical protein BKA70DRAFT_1446634 [Coprinopsis sp. MPI-PUGE-AT-0042]|nr:hypothetical protein BKA70DRAFT_1446634 [Coprinopsis sp. MPI-PUGE-AT-0042]